MHVIKFRQNLKNKWWIDLIRRISYVHFRHYFWLLPLYIILIVFFWWLLLSGKCSSCTSNCGNCPICEEIIEEPKKDSLYFEADYLVITYQFNEQGGMDLDTRTQIIAPVVSEKYGYCINSSGGSSNLVWSGDNQGYGVESCVVDLNTFGQSEKVVVQCDAFWFNRKNSGSMSLDIRAYKGGSMSLSNFQFINSGGEQTANVRFEDTVQEQMHKCIEGERIGVIIYDKAEQKLSFEKQ
ncbi:MAG: hypothetical protein RIR06_1583 [Bacteroidota bacterium]|jgi:hypothetical protein